MEKFRPETILRISAHRSVDSKLQYRVEWKNGRSSWENAERFETYDPSLHEYWTITSVEYVNKSVQTDPINIPTQAVDDILNYSHCTDIVKNLYFLL